MNNFSKISVTILTKNAEETLHETLKSVSKFEEVIVIDGFSDDSTMQIIKEYPNIKLFESKFVGFGQLKNLASSLSSNSWILSLDADEVLSNELLNEIENLRLDEKIGYSFRRENIVLGKRIRYSGLGNERVVRLFNKEYYSFADKLVHEFVDLKDGKSLKLKGNIIHNSVRDVTSFLYKIAHYSKLASEENEDKKVFIFTPLIKSIFAFIRTYILRLGFLDGWRGLLIAVSNANGRFYRYIRYLK
jgi:glycosyltransferase involved in cell wall biosynthesis